MSGVTLSRSVQEVGCKPSVSSEGYRSLPALVQSGLLLASILVAGTLATHWRPAEREITQPSAGSAAFVVDLNNAGLGELMALPDVGPSMAKRILDYRQSEGPFQTVEELMKVRGIGEKTLQHLYPMLIVSDSTVSERATENQLASMKNDL